MKTVDAEDFVYATDEQVAAGIENDVVDDVQDWLSEPVATEAAPAEQEEYEASDEGVESEPVEEESQEDSDDEEETEDDSEDYEPPTDDKKIAKAMHKAREKVRRARQAEREAQERALKIEQELAYIRGKMEVTELHKPKEEPAEAPPGEFDYADLEGSVDARLTYRQQLEAKKAQQKAVEEWQALAQASSSEAQEAYPDYLEVEAAFIQRMKSPKGEHLNKLLYKQADPAEWLYHNQKRYEKRVKQDPPEVAALKQELEDLKKQIKAGKKKPAAKQTLARARGGVQRSRGETGPLSKEDAFDSIFK